MMERKPLRFPKDITVYKKPAINFSADHTVGCSPLLVDFSSSLSAGDGTITGAIWNFGDGNSQSTTSVRFQIFISFLEFIQ